MGIFPYVLKLLQTTATDLRQTLVLIWAKIMAWDTNSQVGWGGSEAATVRDHCCKHTSVRPPCSSPTRAHGRRAVF